MNKITISNPKIGSDVEFFVWDTKRAEVVSAEGYIAGTKQVPTRFDAANPWFATQLDNVLAEGNIPPASSAADFSAYLTRLREHIDSVLPDGLRTAAMSAATLRKEFLETENAKSFGCSPSINAWTMQESTLPPRAADSQIRSAGFHIHVGYDDPSEAVNRHIALAMDVFVGVPSVLLEDASARTRRAFGYGRAGDFRHQPHGMEYRVLPSSLCGSPKLIEWTFNATKRALHEIEANHYRVYRDSSVNSSVIQDIINNSNADAAKKVVSAFRIALP